MKKAKVPIVEEKEKGVFDDLFWLAQAIQLKVTKIDKSDLLSKLKDIFLQETMLKNVFWAQS